MLGFRLILVAIFVVVAAYTVLVMIQHGPNLFPVFFGDIARMQWPGQFNLDFTCLLLLSGLWVAWRHQFSPAGLVLGLTGVVGGSLFLSAYLLVETARVRGDLARLLLGPARTA